MAKRQAVDQGRFQPDPLWRDASMAAEALVIDDVAEDRRFETSTIIQNTGIRMFCAVPLRDSDGTALGVLCVGDTRPRTMSPGAVRSFRALALQAEMRIRLELRLSNHSLVDAITELPTRQAWEGDLTVDLARAKRSARPVCVALLSVDHFARYVEQNGDEAADRLLARCANAWRHSLRATDAIVRYDTSLFAVILNDCPIDIAAPQLERLRHLVPDGQTCSIGVAAWNGTETHGRLMVRVATALEVAQTQGRDRVVTDQGLTETA